MSRTIAVRAASAALLASGLTAALPAADAAAPTYQPWGGAHAKNQVLRTGCHNYPYRYRIAPPGKHWIGELQLISSRGVRIASAAFIAEADKASGRRTWRLCRAPATYGRYTMKFKITYYDDDNDPHVGHVRPTHFTLRRP